MNSNLASPSGHRRTLRFGVSGLAARDEVLLKSFMRLLAHRTEHDWKFSGGADGDVLVVGQGGEAGRAHGKPVLVVGPQRSGEPHFVATPFHAGELEAALNALGRSLLAVPAPRAETVAASVGTAVALLRWPPAELLTSAVRLRMATLMTGRAVTLPVLQQRCGCELADCTGFLAELSRTGLLEVRQALPAAAMAKAPAPPVEPGLLERIRRRLGRANLSRA